MQDYRKDAKFNAFLTGGVRDLEPHVGQLVYELWKKDIVTRYSCEGHIGTYDHLRERNSLVRGYVLGIDGKISLKNTKTSQFCKTLTLVHEVTNSIPFARVDFFSNTSSIILTFDDLLVSGEFSITKCRTPPENWKYLQQRGEMNEDQTIVYAKEHIPEALAKKRLAKIYSVWDMLLSKVQQM